MSTTKQDNNLVDSVDAWADLASHSVVCPTGARVTIKIPDLAGIIEGGELPQNLLDAALAAAGSQTDDDKKKKVTVEDIKRDRQFTHFLVAKTLVAPSVTPEQAERIPVEDKEMIAAIALRLRDLDAEGSHISGLEKSEKFRRFRGLGEFEPTVEG